MLAASRGVVRCCGPSPVRLKRRWTGRGERRTHAMEERGKFDKYTEFWRDVERAREDIF
jgi:hypothetical protein